MAEATTFHLIRHASYDLLGRVLAGRSPGHALSPAGRAEAEMLAAALALRPIAAVVSSPLQRARETAAPIAQGHKLELQVDAHLSEIDFGDWTGRLFADLHADPAWKSFNLFRGTAPIPGGETMLAAQHRALAAILRLRSAYPGAEVVVVSHGDVVKALVAHFLGAPLDLMRRIEISPASRTEIRLGATHVAIATVNLPVGN